MRCSFWGLPLFVIPNIPGHSKDSGEDWIVTDYPADDELEPVLQPTSGGLPAQRDGCSQKPAKIRRTLIVP